MRASEQPRARRPSLLSLLTAQVGYQLRLLVRSPMASFATLVIPLMVLLAVNLLYNGTRLSDRGNILYAQFFTPAMVAFAVVNVCYMSVISSTTLARDGGILKRIRSTPLPAWIYMAGRLVAAGVVAACAATVVIAVGAGVYGFEIVWSAIPAVLATIGLAIFCFCALGLAVTVLVPAADSALPIAWGTILPLCFISDVFQPIDNAPGWLRAIASVFPLRPFADALETAFNPVVGSRTIQWGHLGVLAGWGLAAAVFAFVAFRWEPDGSRMGAAIIVNANRDGQLDSGRFAFTASCRRTGSQPLVNESPSNRRYRRSLRRRVPGRRLGSRRRPWNGSRVPRQPRTPASLRSQPAANPRANCQMLWIGIEE
jgi:ABC-2 type transport system permease protein